MRKTKTAVIIADGAADFKIPELGGKTPLEYASKPCTDNLVKNAVCGFVKNVPDGMIPESDTAILSILGYDPRIYSKGRSPLEAASMGLEMREADTALRCNLVSLTESQDAYGDKIITDHSADNISTEEAGVLVKFLHGELGSDKIRFHAGVSYRHCVLWENCPPYENFARPHDILNKKIGGYLQQGEYLELMRRSYELLNNHPVNSRRREKNKRPANSIWFWSPGAKYNIPKFKQKGSVIAAVDLVKGIGICAGMNVADVAGATGDFNTNYKGKGEAAIREFGNGADFVLIHAEAPDECGHQGVLAEKVASIELIDANIVKPVFEYLNENCEDFKILILPDHPTPVSIRTHTGDPVPFLFYDNLGKIGSGISNFCESEVSGNGELFIPDGSKLLEGVLDCHFFSLRKEKK